MDGLAKRSSRRALFGAGRAPETDEWLRELENKNMEEKVKKWNFDFREGKPLVTDESSSSHVYEAVDEEKVPSFYHTKTIGPSGVSRSLFIHPAKKVTKRSDLKQIEEEKEIKTTTMSKDAIPSTSELIDSHEEKPTVSTSTLSSTSIPSPHKRLRKARRSEITPQKRKKVVATATTGIVRKRAKRGIKMEKDVGG
ncbi:hypothetical protein ACQ4LE_006916 [Meloidogyne hapla]|uniref:CDI domain-containing protein n=1 Tax=Meloidogyne hapla TaxID=6305 RepID=A0A1I8AZX4_MELHA